MSALGDQLNILRNTQMVQRRHLEKLYPYLDWSKMPFSSYNDFFRLKNIIDDCGAVWTNAYSRSNNEAADTRKYLKDYSGNGRDIELHNFSFSKMSGYNGYTQDFLEFTNSPKISRTSTKIIVNKVDNAVSTTLSASIIPDRRFRLKFRISGLNQPIPEGNQDVLTFRIYDNGTSPVPIDYKEDGIHEVDYTLTADATLLYFFCFLSSFRSAEIQPITIEQLPLYPGALVSDGVDDYGQCIKDFALPDDYTVVAMRKILGDIYSAVSEKAAFIFELGAVQAQSYGSLTNLDISKRPALFSYQTKMSYNGNNINVGSNTDTVASKLTIFTHNATTHQVALSSLGIFTRTLTEDELRIVKNCMMAEYIAMTGILDDVEYYDILDARFRSNDEDTDTDKRNKWTGRFGKLHMTLHNYAFSGNSGWNGETGEDGKPLYGGALVSDGVDDYAVSDETISEEIGGFVCYAEKYGEKSNAYAFDTNNNESRLYAYADAGNLISGTPDKSGQVSPFFVLSRNPASPAGKLLIGSNNTNIEFGDFALYQLRLIKSQPTDIQLEAIKWQMQKEHEDYLIQNGWMEIEPEEQ